MERREPAARSGNLGRLLAGEKGSFSRAKGDGPYVEKHWREGSRTNVVEVRKKRRDLTKGKNDSTRCTASACVYDGGFQGDGRQERRTTS